jgi:hypothetical protein
MLTARGILVTYETIRQWDMKFGPDRQPHPSASPTPVLPRLGLITIAGSQAFIPWATVVGVAMAA